MEKKFADVSSYEVYEKLEELYVQVQEVETSILKIKGPTSSNGVLDLYFDEENSTDEVLQYDIAFSGTFEIIGNVLVSSEYSKSLLGNIGYTLDREYRGHGYMLQALEMLREPLIHKGIKKPLLSVSPANISSIETIKKFGGHMVDSKEKGYLQYEVELEENGENHIRR